MSSAATPTPILHARPAETLAERFWSLAKGMADPDPSDPVAVVRQVLAVLDALEHGETGGDVTVNTLSFLALLRQQEVKGDLLYASPEQARGESMDERSLVFSVGVLLFERLTGRHPFGAEGNPNRLARIRRGEIASGVNYFPKVPAALRYVLVKAMGPFPEERWSNLSELRGRLEAFVDAPNDEEVTRIVRRQLPAMPRGSAMEQTPPPRIIEVKSSLQPRPPATPPATPQVIAEPERTAQIPRAELPLGQRHSWLAPVGWMAAGAAVASLAFALLGGGSAPASEAAVVAEAEAKPAVEQPVAVPAIAAGPAAEPTAEPEPEPEPVPEPEPTIFDAELGGEKAIAAAMSCFSEERLAGGLQLGVSLMYRAEDGLSHKAYFGPNSLEPREQGCVSEALVGLAAGAAPDRNTVVVYNMFLTPDGGTVKARVKE